VAGPALRDLLEPTHSSDLQLAAVRALALHDQPVVPETLLRWWNGYSPAVRSEVLEALFARTDWLKQLLDAVDKKTVLASQLAPARVEQLRRHRDTALRQRAELLLAGRAAPERQKVIDEYRTALTLKGDAGKGKLAFKRVCATCHRLENEGFQVGPDLLAALPNKTSDGLLIDILDPSREVDPRYVNYLVETSSGKVLTGIMASEGPTSIVLKRAEGTQDILLRSQIEANGIQATGKSLMPDELEKQLTQQDFADLIAYLRSATAAAPKK
jgi:putative heme-binding domain-containing protein